MIEQIIHLLKKEPIHILGHKQMKKYAVLIPLIKQEDGTLAILFEKRAMSLRRQPGEISFPGGKIDDTDKNPQAAAIRETCEELGVREDKINNIYELGYYTPSRHTIIYPFVAALLTAEFNLNPEEVEETFLVPLNYFLENEPNQYKIKLKVEPEVGFPFDLIPGGRNYPWRYEYVEELFYQYEEYTIWGMTAHILHQFVLLIKRK